MSHVNMDVFWSSTDKTTMDELAKHGWFVSSVFNKSGKVKSALIQNVPFPVYVNDISTEINVEDSLDTEELDKQFEEKVKRAQSFSFDGFEFNDTLYNDFFGYRSLRTGDFQRDTGIIPVRQLKQEMKQDKQGHQRYQERLDQIFHLREAGKLTEDELDDFIGVAEEEMENGIIDDSLTEKLNACSLLPDNIIDYVDDDDVPVIRGSNVNRRRNKRGKK